MQDMILGLRGIAGTGNLLGNVLTPSHVEQQLFESAPESMSLPVLRMPDMWLRVMQTDFGYFGPPEEHLQWTQEEREATYITPEDPSSEICGEVAAAFAASSLALKDTGKGQAFLP